MRQPGLLIAAAGTGVCFLVNAASYAAVILALWGMDARALHPAPAAERRPGQVRAGLRYVVRTPGLVVPLAMLALVGAIAYEFSVTLPVLAHRTFDGGAGTYAAFTSAMGAGAIMGGLVVAGRNRTGIRALSLAALGFGAAIGAAALAPWAALEEARTEERPVKKKSYIKYI